MSSPKSATLRVDDQGMIKLGDDLRVHFQYEIQHIATNGTVVADHRPGRQGTESQPAGFSKLSAIDSRAEQHLSSYFICGPLVFPLPQMDIWVVCCGQNTARPSCRV